MGRRYSHRLLFTALCLAGGGSCAERPLEIGKLDSIPGRCGTGAAFDYRASEKLRESPPACAFPDAESLALVCAIHDLVRSPGYRMPIFDEHGGRVEEGSPAPVYEVTDVRCRFISSERNRATCRFRLRTPEMSAGPADTKVALEHRSWQDHGPAHHLYGTQWLITASCVPPDGRRG
jgi:hypothetical protein